MFVPLLNRLRLWQKFTLLGVLGLLLVGPPLLLYVLEANKSIDFTQVGRAAIAPGRAAHTLLRLVQQHRGLSAAELGAHTLLTQRQAIQVEANQALAALEADMAQDPRLRGLLGNLRADWTRLAQGGNAGQWTVRQSYALHTALCQSLVELIERIADASGLSLDPQTNRYHLMRAVFVTLPAATEALGEVRAKGASALSAHTIDSVDRVLMYELLSRAASTQNDLRKAMDKAIAADPTLRTALSPLLATALDDAQRAQQLTRQEVAMAADLRYPAADYLAVLTIAIDAQFNLLNVALPTLDHLLQHHIDQTRTQRNVMIALVLLLATLAGVCGWLIARSVLRPMKKTLQIAQAVSAGQFDTPILVDPGQEEGALMLAALGQMQAALGQARAAEQAAKQDFFRGLLESAPDAVVVSDRSGAIILVNEQTLKLFGYERAALIGQSIDTLVPQRNRGTHAAHRDTFFQHPALRTMGTPGGIFGCRCDGTEFPVEIRLSPVQTEQGLVVSATIRDITLRLQAEQELQRHRDQLEELVAARTAELAHNIETLHSAQDELVRTERLASLGALVASISHDLNTPIGNATLTATTLRDHVAVFRKQVEAGMVRKSEFNEFLSTNAEMADLLVRSMQRATDLIASFKQVAVDQTSERRREFDLKTSVHDVLVTLKPGLKNKPWQIAVDVEDDLRCDSYPGPLGQVISNLVLNATLHAFEGRSQGRIHITGHALPNDQVELVIADDGIGMHASALQHAFEAFFTTKMGRGGSGLGLFICKGIATGVLGGNLTIESTPGQGTRFTLTFPRTAPAPAEPAPPAPGHPGQ